MQLTQKNINNNDLLMEINQLNVFFDTPDGVIQAVKDVNLSINKGECLGVVGESGSGKTQTFFSITGLLSRNGYCDGSAKFKGFDLIKSTSEEKRMYLGKSIGFIFQDPMTSLTPHMQVGEQLAEISILHDNLSKKEALKRANDVLDIVKLPKSRNLINSYPHELSGGMKQRIMIAISLMCSPELIIADEPTTALDVTTQAEILNIFNDLRINMNIGIILISHNIGVIAETSNKIAVMKNGSIVEKGNTYNVLTKPQNSYTKHLLSCIPPWLES
jgi:ABC-type dipeptide/oligopeptide/nickel transport system ATPase component